VGKLPYGNGSSVQSEEGDGLAKATANTKGRMERVLNILDDREGDERKTVDDGQLLTTDGGLLIHQGLLERSYTARQAVENHLSVSLLPCLANISRHS
jgi:hypothetical protein